MCLFRKTKEQIQETIDFARDLRADWILFHIAVPLPGAEIFDQFVSMGAIDRSDAAGITGYFERAFDTPEISAQELKDVAYRANIEINFLQNVNKVEGHYRKAIDIYEDILSMYPFHTVGHYCVMECYEALGDIDNAAHKKAEIAELLADDKEANRMFFKFRELMPSLTDLVVDPLISSDELGKISGMGNEQAARRVKNIKSSGILGKAANRKRAAAI